MGHNLSNVRSHKTSLHCLVAIQLKMRRLYFIYSGGVGRSINFEFFFYTVMSHNYLNQMMRAMETDSQCFRYKNVQQLNRKNKISMNNLFLATFIIVVKFLQLFNLKIVYAEIYVKMFPDQKCVRNKLIKNNNNIIKPIVPCQWKSMSINAATKQ